MKRHQSGFTLVEIAIVLVIIGLLLGGVLKGQQMIENARIKSVVNDMRGVSAAYNAYLDRYHAIPGDETLPTVTARGWVPPVTLGGNGDGVLTATVAATFTNAAAGEQDSMWQHLRAAGMTTGDPSVIGVAALPRTGTGGLIGVAVDAYGQTGVSVCVSGLSTRQALGVDTTIDGTLPAANIGNNVGTARGATGVAPLAPTAVTPGGLAYNETLTTTPWTMCNLM